MKRRREGVLLLAVALGLGALGSACKRSRAMAEIAEDAPRPPTVKDDSQGLLLTWVDDKGDFHVESKVADVPMMGRDAVRVVDPAAEDRASGGRVFVVDLRQVRPDGTYPVRTMSRADFEAIAVARREKAGPTLANAGPSPSGSASGAAAAADPGKEPSRALVIVYGAEWCGACHEAMRYLRQKGIPYVEKDIEKDPAAAREMQQKLARSGLRAGSIPIIDVRGKIMVGFSAPQIDAALGGATL